MNRQLAEVKDECADHYSHNIIYDNALLLYFYTTVLQKEEKVKLKFNDNKL